MKMSPLRNCAVATVVLLVAACSGKDGAESAFTDEDSLLRYVPADTPYLLYTGEPLPDDLLDGLEPKMDRMLAAYRDMLRESYRAGAADGSGSLAPAERVRTDAVFEAFISMLSPQGIEEAGFDRNSRLVFFGNGLLPVLRIEVKDEAAFDAAVSSLEDAAGEELETMTVGSDRFRYLGNDQGRLVIGVAGGNALVTFIPPDLSDDDTRVALGLTLPDRSIAETTILSDIAGKYDFSSHYLGFVDSHRLAASFLEEPAGLNAALFGQAEFDSAAVSAVCREEIMDVVDIAPRMVFGYDQVDIERISGSLIVELRSDIASQLTGVAAPVPGLGLDQGGLVSFGMSLNLMAWRGFLEARLDALEADPFECEYFADIQQSVARGRDLLATPIPPIAYGVRGFNAVVQSLDGFDFATRRPPSSVEAGIVIAMEDPLQLVATGSMFSPQLAALDLEPNGVPQALVLPQLQSVGDTAYAAMLDDALAVTVGAEAESRVGEILTSDSAKPPVVFAMSMDAGKYYELVGTGVKMDSQDADDAAPSPEMQASVAELMTILGEIYDRMATSLRFTENGLELHTEVTLDAL